MKKSNILIVIPVVLILIGFIFYNFKLKELYDTKEYKNRFRDMDYTVIQGVNALDLKSANHICIQVEYGTKEGLWVAKRLKDNIKISTNGPMISLDFVKKEQSAGRIMTGDLILITKDLLRITATRADNATSGLGQVRLIGFKLSKIDIQVAADTQFYFDDVQIDTLNAKIGGDNYAGKIILGEYDYAGKAKLILPFNCMVNEARFNIGINGSVDLQGAKILNIQSSKVSEIVP